MCKEEGSFSDFTNIIPACYVLLLFTTFINAFSTSAAVALPFIPFLLLQLLSLP